MPNHHYLQLFRHPTLVTLRNLNGTVSCQSLYCLQFHHLTNKIRKQLHLNHAMEKCVFQHVQQEKVQLSLKYHLHNLIKVYEALTDLWWFEQQKKKIFMRFGYTDQRLHQMHMPENTFSHGIAHIYKVELQQQRHLLLSHHNNKAVQLSFTSQSIIKF